MFATCPILGPMLGVPPPASSNLVLHLVSHALRVHLTIGRAVERVWTKRPYLMLLLLLLQSRPLPRLPPLRVQGRLPPDDEVWPTGTQTSKK